MNSAVQFGQCLKIDLNSGTCSFSGFPQEACEYFGGRGFNLWYLYHHLKTGIDPLSPENILMISCGFLTGSAAPGSARLHINALSPLTNILGSSNIGGYAGAWLRSLNIATLIITGKSKKPVYLSIDSNGAHIKDASAVWGRDTFETQDKIKQSHGNKNLKILPIGPGGENKIGFAAIINEKDHAAGRTGMGAVMGSKNLKAVVIAKGDFKHFPAVRQKQKKAVQSYIMKIRNAPEFPVFSKFGSAGYVKWANDFGIMGSKNYSETSVANINRVDGRALENNIVKSSGCYRCPVQCKAELDLPEKDSKTTSTRPEFEPMINLGPKCGLDDIKKIVRLDNLCTRLGLDSTSAATVIAFAMDLFDKKILPENLAQGLDLSWGNAAVMETLLHQIVQGKGLGKILRLGVKRAANVIGQDSLKFAAHVKGLELTAYHPSTIMGTALGYAVSSRGGDYNNVYASLEYNMTQAQAQKEFGTRQAVDIKSTAAKGALIKKAVITNIMVDSLGLCKVPVFSLLRSFNLKDEVELIHGLTGMDLDHTDLLAAGGKIAALEKHFNIKHAPQKTEDTLPGMFFNADDPNGLTKENLEIMIQEYYAAMGWDEKGIPPVPA